MSAVGELALLTAALGGAYGYRRYWKKAPPPKVAPRTAPMQHAPYGRADEEPRFVDQQHSDSMQHLPLENLNSVGASIEMGRPEHYQTVGGETIAQERRFQNDPYVQQASAVNPVLQEAASRINGIRIYQGSRRGIH